MSPRVAEPAKPSGVWDQEGGPAVAPFSLFSQNPTSAPPPGAESGAHLAGIPVQPRGWEQASGRKEPLPTLE